MICVCYVFVGVFGFVLVIVGLVWWIGLDVIQKYCGDLVYYIGKYLELVFSLMVLVLVIGILVGIVLFCLGV